MTWNGTDITGVPTLIYHDELLSYNGPNNHPDAPGRLLCISRTPRPIYWSYPTDASRIPLLDTSDNFFHRRGGSNPVLSRLSRNSENPITTPRTDQRANGLWRCNENNGPTLYVGLYARVPGEPLNSVFVCTSVR